LYYIFIASSNQLVPFRFADDDDKETGLSENLYINSYVIVVAWKTMYDTSYYYIIIIDTRIRKRYLYIYNIVIDVKKSSSVIYGRRCNARDKSTTILHIILYRFTYSL